MVESGHFDKMNRILAEKRMDPKWRAEDSARRSKVRKNKKRTGPNPMQGRHHTPEAKAKIGAATSKRHSTYTTADLLRLHAPPMPAPTAFDFFRTTSPPPPPPEKRDEFTGGYYVEDIFGNDEFDPFH